MATNITGVTMTAPSSDPNIQTQFSFSMTGVISSAGGGGWAESGDMYFEWDQGSGSWTTIGSNPTSGLYTADTNPILTLQTTTPQTITVYGGAAGSFQVRITLIEDDLTTYNTTPVNVTVTAPSNAEASAVEAYNYLDDNDGVALTLTQSHNLDVALEQFHVLDDNDGAPITIHQDILPVNLVISDAGECYHLLDDNDATNITISQTTFTNLVISDAGECYHLHDADPAPLTQLHLLNVALEQFHLHDGDPADPLTQVHLLTVAEAFSLLDDNDGLDLSLAASVLLDVAETYHLHEADNLDLTAIHSLDVQPSEIFQVTDGDLTLAQKNALVVAEAFHLLDDNDGTDITVAQFDVWADAYEAVVGTLISGTLADTHGQDFNYMIFEEVTGTPGFAIDYTFYNVPASWTTEIHINVAGYYEGNPAHVVRVQAWNYTTTSWDYLTASPDDMPSRSEDAKYSWMLTDIANQVSPTGEVKFRFLHDWAGSANHFLYVDGIRISEDGAWGLLAVDCYHLHDADNLDLTQTHILGVDETAHLVVSDNISLSGVVILDNLEAFHLHDADPLDLTGTHELDVAPADHLHDADPLLLTGTHELAVAETFHLHTAAEISVTQNHQLTVAESDHLQTAANVTLLVAGALPVDESDHLLTSAEISVTQDHQLDVAESNLDVTSTNISLGGVIALTVQEASHLQTADNVDLTLTYVLTVDATDHLHASDNLVLTAPATILAVAGADHLHESDTIDFGQSFISVSETYIRMTSDNVVLTTDTAVLEYLNPSYWDLTTSYSIESVTSDLTISRA